MLILNTIGYFWLNFPVINVRDKKNSAQPRSDRILKNFHTVTQK